MFDQQQIFQSKIDITVGGDSISIDGTSFPITVNIMSQDLNWSPVFWDTESDLSIGGKKRSNIRGYDLTITLDYDRMLEPDKLTTILDGLVYARNSNYVVRFYPDASDDTTSFVVIPSGDTKRLLGYDETVKTGEQPKLVFESESILSQVASSGSTSPITDDVDADTLDGLDSVQFLRSDVDDTFTGGTLTVDGLLDMNQNRIAQVATPVNNSDAVTKGYVDAIEAGLDWQESVIDEINDPSTVTPSDGDRYLVGESPVGDFSGHAEEIAVYDGGSSSWSFIVPDDGTTLEIESNGFIWIWNGSDWVRFGSAVSHNQLQDLDASDHMSSTVDDGLAFYDSTVDKFDTSSDLTWDGSLFNVGGQGTFSGLLTAQAGIDVTSGNLNLQENILVLSSFSRIKAVDNFNEGTAGKDDLLIEADGGVIFSSDRNANGISGMQEFEWYDRGSRIAYLQGDGDFVTTGRLQTSVGQPTDIYHMNQPVRTTDDVQFGDLDLVSGDNTTLTIEQTGGAGYPSIFFADDGVNDFGIVDDQPNSRLEIRNSSNDLVHFGQAGNIYLQPENAGNVGINASTPDNKLHINNGGQVGTGSRNDYAFGAGSETQKILIGYETDVGIGLITAVENGVSFKDISFPHSDVVIGDTATEGYTLNVNGTSQFKDTARITQPSTVDAVLEFFRNGTNVANVEGRFDGLFLDASQVIRLGITGTEFARFTNAGGLAINTTNGEGYLLNVNGTSQFKDDVTFLTEITSDDYISGIFGSGSTWDNDQSGGSFLEIDNLRIRDTLRTHIFKKDIVRASNAFLYISDAGEIQDTVTTPSTTGSTFTLTVDNNVFTTNDVVEYKDIDLSSGSIFSVTATIDDNGTSRTLNGKTVYDYGATLDAGTDVTLNAGDTVVRTSGGTILNDASSSDSPFIDVLNGGTVKARYGNLAGIADTINGEAVTGFGIYSDNAFLKGGIVATYGAIGGFDITSNRIESGTNLVLDSPNEFFSINDTTFGNTGIQLQYNGGTPRAFIGVDTGNYIKFDGTSVDIVADIFNLSSTGIGINSSTPEVIVGSVFDVNGSTNTGQIAGWEFGGDALWTDSKDTSGFTSSGITLSSNGSIHTPYFYSDSNGAVFNGKLQVGGKDVNTIFAKGSSNDNTGNDGEELRVNGNVIYTSHGRGLRLTVYDQSMNQRHAVTYDLYGTDQDRTDLGNILLGNSNLTDGSPLTENDLVILTSHDAHRALGNQTLIDGIDNVGGNYTTHYVELDSGNVHAPYVLIGQLNLGRGNGFESFISDTNTDTSDVYASVQAYYIDGNIHSSYASKGTTVVGDTITSGFIRSNNWDATTGTSFNLDDGIIRMRNGANEVFTFDAQAGTADIAGWTFDNQTLKKSFTSPDIDVYAGVDNEGHTGFKVHRVTENDQLRMIYSDTNDHMQFLSYTNNGSDEITIGDDHRGILNSMGIRVRSQDQEVLKVDDTGAEIAGWTFSAQAIEYDNGTRVVSLASDATVISSSHASEPVLSIYDRDVDLMVNMGNIYKDSTRTGFKIWDDYINDISIFEVTTDGTSTIAQIAGWTFDEQKLTNNNVYIGNDLDGLNASQSLFIGNWRDGNFPMVKVTGDNTSEYVEMVYNTANGEWGIRGDNGTGKIFELGSTNQIAGWNFESDKLYGGNTSGEYTGMQPGAGTTKAFFAGADDKTGTNAKFFARADGKIFHDSIGKVLYSKEQIADFSEGDDVGAITVNKWHERAQSSGTSNNTESSSKIVKLLNKKFGEDLVNLKGTLELQRSTDGSSVDGSAKVILKVSGESAEKSFETFITGTSDFEISLDVSGVLGEDTNWYIEVIVQAFVDGLDSDASLNTVDAYLHDDCLLWTSTI